MIRADPADVRKIRNLGSRLAVHSHQVGLVSGVVVNLAAQPLDVAYILLKWLAHELDDVDLVACPGRKGCGNAGQSLHRVEGLIPKVNGSCGLCHPLHAYAVGADGIKRFSCLGPGGDPLGFTEAERPQIHNRCVGLSKNWAIAQSKFKLGTGAGCEKVVGPMPWGGRYEENCADKCGCYHLGCLSLSCF